jgi:DNA-binding SARP family transcriptional activator
MCVYLFGKFSVECENRVWQLAEAAKERELFCYLLIHRNRPHPRESLANLLWSETTTEKSKKYLRQALWHLHGAFEKLDIKFNNQVIQVEHDWVQLNSNENLRLDVSQFEETYKSIRDVSGAEVSESSAAAMQKATDLYRGELLEGWYQDWCLFERERFHNMYLTMLDKLLSYCRARHLFDTGINYGLTLLRYDRANEKAHRQLMRLQYMAGNRTEALRQYERCVTALKEELDIRPERRTENLYKQICTDQPLTSVKKIESEDTTLFTNTLSRLKQLKNFLLDVQQRLDRDIETIESKCKNINQKH